MLNHMTAGYIITYRSSMIHFNITPVLSFSVRSTVLLFSGFSNRTFYELYFSPTWALFPAQIIHNYLLTYSTEQSPTWESTGFQLVKKFSAFLEPEGSLPHSQVPATCPYPEPTRFSPYPPHPTSWRSILILSSNLRLGLPNCLFPSGFPTTCCLGRRLPE